MIGQILSTLLDVILPLSIPVAAGAALVRFRKLETAHLLTLVLYFLAPVLIFRTLLTAQLSSGDVRDSLLFSFLNLAVMWALSAGLSRLLRLPPPETAGLSLVATLTNSVNYGLPLVLLAYGKAGLDKASVYVILQMIIVHKFGVFFAARSRFSVRGAIKSVFSLPALYAAVLAILLRASGSPFPQGWIKGCRWSRPPIHRWSWSSWVRRWPSSASLPGSMVPSRLSGQVSRSGCFCPLWLRGVAFLSSV